MNEVNLVDIPRIYTAIAEWMGCMLAIALMPKRYLGKKLVGICIAALVVQCIVLEVTGDVPIYFWVPAMMLAIALMYLFLYICLDVNKIRVGYSCAHAFIWAEFTASLEWQMYCYFVSNYAMYSIFMRVVILVCIYGLVFIFVYLLNRKFFGGRLLDTSKYELLSAVLITGLAFGFSNMSFLFPDTPFSAQIVSDIFWTRTLVDLCGLIIMYSYHMQRREFRMEQELESIRQTLQLQYVQYKQYAESIEVINYKYHDLKHQIQGLRAETNLEAREKWLEELESDLITYEGSVKTGNSVLDTLLTGKNMYCIKHGINLTCVVDGKCLDFMSSMDLCSVFGNALDNAIESVRQLLNREERLIHLNASIKKGFVLILCENYCKERPNFEKGLPTTTKQDSQNHGFGLKSIRYTIQKYEGTMTVDYSKNWFRLKILLPKKE